MSRPRPERRRRRDRYMVEALLRLGERVLDTVVAAALIVGGVVLLVAILYDFASSLGEEPVVDLALELLSNLLLVFIFTELITTLGVVIASGEVRVEPFLIVGVVAAIRRLIVLGAEAENLAGTPGFRDLLLEIAVLAGTVLVLGVTMLILRLVTGRKGG